MKLFLIYLKYRENVNQIHDEKSYQTFRKTVGKVQITSVITEAGS